MEQNGTVHRAYLGVLIQPVTQAVGRAVQGQGHQGVLVTEVRADTPAAKAGLKPGDIILQFAGKPVASPRELQGIVERSTIGSSQPLIVLRDGKQMTLNVTCSELPADATAVARPAGRGEGGSVSRFEKLGIQAETLTGRWPSSWA